MSSSTVNPPSQQSLPPSSGAPSSEMSHRQIVEALVGILAALFVGMVSSTIVSNALPTIIADLDGSQRAYTWLVTATLLAMTATTPIWGKLSDLFNKKFLLQLAIVIFVIGSAASGASQNVGMMIGFRVIQGVGMGGITALSQTVIGAMIPPRQRGRYNGYLGSVMALATVSGPLIGGVIVDSSLGWRWCFYVCVPLAVIALVLIQKTLHLEHHPRKASIDWAGATLIAAAVSAVLIWVSFAGDDFAWMSWQTAAFLVGAGVVLALAVVVERRVKEPVVPPAIISKRTTLLAVIASLAVGIAMFGGSVFLGQYFQVARGYSPTQAGLLTMPLMLGVMVSSIIVGRLIVSTGYYKRYIVGGVALLVVGFGLLGTIDHTTSLVLIGFYMVLVGAGVGASMQNLVLAVQNTVDSTDIGTASGVIAFFRSLGGAVGVTVLGAILASHVTDLIMKGLVGIGIDPAAASSGGSTLDVKSLPAPVAEVVRAAYGDGTARIFLVAAVVGVVGLIATLFIEEVALRKTVSMKPSDVGESPSELVDDAQPVPAGAAAEGKHVR
ncbi:MDR family MFS transporter [Kineosporia sp. NBRC 101731]|uniref:MDR family MFS transporter n=1 Tax=Kineosporia sp. NBRC 101731 TaxID=3032199 RepID=UPI0024A52A8C|nr:MDR family MFS transporter [Kineosporia sp. NBRC 101731]GLY28322.1 MFS transporter [Kineosporia sp. NBRC 101731]